MKISIITATYNSEKTIKDTIQSVYNQTHDDIEYIIVDGKSSDKTVDIIKGFQDKFNTKNMNYIWVSEKDNGIYDAFNKGINLSTGDIIGILNSDDYYFDNNVVRDIHKELKHKNIDCVYGNLEIIHPLNGRVVRRWKSNSYEKGLFEKSWTPAHPTFYCKKRCYDMYGLYRTDFKIAADVELMYRFLDKEHIKSYYMNRNMVKMRRGGVSSSGLKSTILITREMKKAFLEIDGQFNLVKYLWYKFLKVRELL